MFKPSSWLSRVSEKHPKDRKWVRLWHVGPDRITKFHSNPMLRYELDPKTGEPLHTINLPGVYFCPTFKDVKLWGVGWAATGKNNPDKPLYKNLFVTEVKAPTWILEEAEKRVQEAVNISGIENWPFDDSEVFIPESLLDHLEIVKSEMYSTNELRNIDKPPAEQLHEYKPPFPWWSKQTLLNPVERTPDLKRRTPDWAVPWADPEWLAKYPYEETEHKEVDDKVWQEMARPRRYHGHKNKGYL
jgi:hypothetical protein